MDDEFDPEEEARADDGPLGGVTIVRVDGTDYRIVDRSEDDITGEQRYRLAAINHDQRTISYPASLIEKWQKEGNGDIEPVAGPSVDTDGEDGDEDR